LTPVASQNPQEPDRSNDISPIPGTSQKAATIASIATTMKAPSLPPMQAPSPSDPQLKSPRRPGGLDVQEIEGSTHEPNCELSGTDRDTEECERLLDSCPHIDMTSCLIGGNGATPAPTPAKALEPTIDGAYVGGGVTGETTDEMNTNGIWHWGKTVYAEAGNGGWTWLQSPDGDWNLVWVTINTSNRWLWQMPNRFQWSGHHRRRSTWMHMSGADWRRGENVHAHLIAAEENEARGGHHDENAHVSYDPDWYDGMTKSVPKPVPAPAASIAENKYVGRSALSQSGSNSRNQSPRAMPTATLTATHSGAPTSSPADASIEQHFKEVVKYDPLEALKEIKNTEFRKTPLIYGSMAEKDSQR